MAAMCAVARLAEAAKLSSCAFLLAEEPLPEPAPLLEPEPLPEPEPLLEPAPLPAASCIFFFSSQVFSTHF